MNAVIRVKIDESSLAYGFVTVIWLRSRTFAWYQRQGFGKEWREHGACRPRGCVLKSATQSVKHHCRYYCYCYYYENRCRCLRVDGSAADHRPTPVAPPSTVLPLSISDSKLRVHHCHSHDSGEHWHGPLHCGFELREGRCTVRDLPEQTKTGQTFL